METETKYAEFVMNATIADENGIERDGEMYSYESTDDPNTSCLLFVYTDDDGVTVCKMLKNAYPSAIHSDIID